MWQGHWSVSNNRYCLCFASASFVAEPLRLAKPVVADLFGDRDTKGYCGRFIPLGCSSVSANSTSSISPSFTPRLVSGFTKGIPKGAFLIYGSPLEQSPQVIKTLAQRLRVVGNGAKTLKAFARHHNAFRDAITACGGLTPRHTKSGVRLIKAVGRSGGMGIQYAPNSTAPTPKTLTQEAPTHRNSEPPAQQFIKGTSVGLNFFAARGRTIPLVLTSSHTAPTKTAPFRLGGLTAQTNNPPYLQRLVLLARALTRRFGLVGINNLDAVVTKNGKVYALELNPRLGAGLRLLPVATRREALRWHIRSSNGYLPPHSTALRLRRQATGRVAFLYNQIDGVMPPLKKLEGVSDIPAVGSPLKKGEPFCSVFAPKGKILSKRVALVTKSITNASRL